MKKRILIQLFFTFLCYSHIIAQNALGNTTATFFSGGVNSPWTIGLDYDLGFAKLISLNFQFTGGINSQVNRASTFGDIFFGEFQFSTRIYMNKLETWEGLFLSAGVRLGFYDVPLRTVDNPLVNTSIVIINRNQMLLVGAGIYLGYRWQRNMVRDMDNLPFTLAIEPFLGWSLDFLFPFSRPAGFTQTGLNINRFTVGLTFKIGFYTHKKSKEAIERDERLKREAKLKEQEESKTNTN